MARGNVEDAGSINPPGVSNPWRVSLLSLRNQIKLSYKSNPASLLFPNPANLTIPVLKHHQTQYLQHNPGADKYGEMRVIDLMCGLQLSAGKASDH